MKVHTLAIAKIFELLKTSKQGLSTDEVAKRQAQYGTNSLPSKKNAGFVVIFFKQFISPLVFVLLFAAIISIFLGHSTDAGFIFFVLFLNAIIGAVQEFNAQKNAKSLEKIVSSKAFVTRNGEMFEVNAEGIVPGDVIYLQSGDKVPADIRLYECNNLIINESLLTGESMNVTKDIKVQLSDNCTIGDRLNMAFAGTMVSSGRGKGIVTSIGLETQLGTIAKHLHGASTKTPLIIRMEAFTKKISLFIVLIVVIMGIIFYLQGNPIEEILILSVAIAVASIPEGLPVAITIALSIASKRMSKRNVIVKNLPAVEALGSCSYIATDKTGTLTVNELTTTAVSFPGEDVWHITGKGITPEGEVKIPATVADTKKANDLINAIALNSLLCNDAILKLKDDLWVATGDAVDISLMVFAHKKNITRASTENLYTRIAEIPYESENQFQATMHQADSYKIISLKGATERLLTMCSKMHRLAGEVELDAELILAESNRLGEQGFRVLAVAGAQGRDFDINDFEAGKISGLTFFGLVGMIDPLRDESKNAIFVSKQAGINVAMVTGDHPTTALYIAKDLNLAVDENDIVTGNQLKQINDKDGEDFDHLVMNSHVFSRVEPTQKLEIVKSLMRNGHFVAVTGDGANDSPALKVSNVGIAMGKTGTDVARESADLILTDDNFSSIIAGIEEGRVAYSNIRKVIYLLISTGAAEFLIFVLSILLGLPMPLTAVQLLWMNLVTNGIQDVALAFEKAEGDELSRPPRPMDEAIFNKLMIKRVLMTSSIMSIVSILVYKYYLDLGLGQFAASNAILLLMVLFENVMIGNCRSETKSAFSISPFKNPFLLLGTLAAQGLHLIAMHVPFLAKMLDIRPVPLKQWGILFLLSLTVLAVVEIDKLIDFKKILRRENG